MVGVAVPGTGLAVGDGADAGEGAGLAGSDIPWPPHATSASTRRSAAQKTERVRIMGPSILACFLPPALD